MKGLKVFLQLIIRMNLDNVTKMVFLFQRGITTIHRQKTVVQRIFYLKCDLFCSLVS